MVWDFPDLRKPGFKPVQIKSIKRQTKFEPVNVDLTYKSLILDCSKKFAGCNHEDVLEWVITQCYWGTFFTLSLFSLAENTHPQNTSVGTALIGDLLLIIISSKLAWTEVQIINTFILLSFHRPLGSLSWKRLAAVWWHYVLRTWNQSPGQVQHQRL